MDAVDKATEAIHGPLNSLMGFAPDWSAQRNYEAAETFARSVLAAVGYPHQSSDEGTCWCPVAEQAGRERDEMRAERDTLAATVRALESERAGATSTAQCGCRMDGRGRIVHLCAAHCGIDARSGEL